MIDFKVDVSIGDDTAKITGSRDSVLVLIEAARRDLNAMSQAQGASPERRNAYAALAARLNAILAPHPRVNLFSGVVQQPEVITRAPMPGSGLASKQTPEEINLEDDDDILG